MNKKEKLRLILASAFVLTALTLTGIYMSSDVSSESEDYAKLEQEILPELAKNVSEDSNDNTDIEDDTEIAISGNNDMDVDPAFMEANSSSAINDRYGLDNITKETEDTTNKTATGTDKAAVFMEENPLTFSDDDSLVLPIIGDVIMDYSMDSAVYHETMQQYRYSPALVIAANEGDIVTAAVDAKVTDIYTDTQTGKTITFDIGGGYELTYGQLTDIRVNVGDSVLAGDIVGSIASPTIYYSEEGANIYYKLTKNGEPVDPLFREKDN